MVNAAKSIERSRKFEITDPLTDEGDIKVEDTDIIDALSKIEDLLKVLIKQNNCAYNQDFDEEDI